MASATEHNTITRGAGAHNRRGIAQPGWIGQWAQLLAAWRYPAAAGRRDLRLDLLRGFAVLVMIVDHIGGKDSLLYLVSGGDRFFVSAAEGFVFISGLVMGIVYARMIATRGLHAALAKGMRRVATLYGLTVGLSLVFATLSLEFSLPWAPNIASATDALDFLTGVLTLRHAYYLTDVLLLYTLVIAAAMPALALMQRLRHAGWLVLAGSWALWAAWQWWSAGTRLPLGTLGGEIFRFPAWQVLFITGLVAGYYRKSIEQRGMRLVGTRATTAVQSAALLLTGLILGSSIALYLWAQANPQETTVVSQLGLLFGKADLRPGRLALFACLFICLFLLCTIAWTPVKKLLGGLLLPLGQAALPAYTLHLFVIVLFTAAGPQILGSAVDSLSGRTLLQVAGIAVIWGLILVKAPAKSFCVMAYRGLKLRFTLGLHNVGDGLAAPAGTWPRRIWHGADPAAGAGAGDTARPPAGTRGQALMWAAGLVVATLLLVSGGSVGLRAIKNSSVVAALSGRGTSVAAAGPAAGAATADGAPAPASPIDTAPDDDEAVPPEDRSLAALMSGTAAPLSAATSTPVVLPEYIRQETFLSVSLNRTMPYYIYLPPGYASHPEARYPVLYMLHGMSGSRSEWLGYGLPGRARDMMRVGQIAEFIIVLPQGDKGYWVDHPNGGPLWGTYTARDLVSEVDSRFRTLADRQHRAIGGLSMGGTGALELAVLYPDVFGVVGADSPSLHTYASAPSFYGSRSYFDAHDPTYLYKALPDVARTLKLYIDIGELDPWLPEANNFHAMLQAEGVAHEWHVYPDGHEGTYWSTHVLDYLLFYSSALLPASQATPASAPLPNRSH